LAALLGVEALADEPVADTLHLNAALRSAATVQKNSSAEYTLYGPYQGAGVWPVLGTRRYFEHDVDDAMASSLRGILAWEPKPGLALNAELLESVAVASRPLSSNSQSSINRFEFSAKNEHFEASLGRQPIDLSESYFFSPLDLFDPFDVFDLYRQYRRGEDSLRGAWLPNPALRLELIIVAGGRPLGDLGQVSRPGYAFDGPSGAGSILGHLTWQGESGKLSLLGGRHGNEGVFGGALQWKSEAWKWIAEGVLGYELYNTYYSAVYSARGSLGVEQRLSPAWSWRFETHNDLYAYYVSNGSFGGEFHPQSVLGLSYQAGPKLSLRPALLINGIGPDGLARISGLYTLSEQTDLQLDLGAPIDLNDSEFSYTGDGVSPYYLKLELRAFF
jgi:hypothetical protein